MASWAVYTAMTGYSYDLPAGKIGFAPAVDSDSFQCFFSHGKAWGIYKQEKQTDGSIKKEVEVLYGSMEGIEVE